MVCWWKQSYDFMGRISGGPPKTIDIIQNCLLCFLVAFFVLSCLIPKYRTLLLIILSILCYDGDSQNIQNIFGPFFFVLGMRSSGYNHTQFLNLHVLSKISQNIIHMWKSWKVLFFNLVVSKLISSLLHGVSSCWKGLHHVSKHEYKQNHSGTDGKYNIFCW